MKSIIKYSKGRGNTYIIHFNDEKVTLYDDLVIKHELLLKKELDEKKLELIKKEQLKLESYYVALRFLNVKMRSKKEVRIYLKKKDYSNDDINETISKLENQGYLNDMEYAKCFIHDRFVLSSDGPIKINNELVKLGISDSDFSIIKDSEWEDKLLKLVNKKVTTYRHDSAFSIKNKIQKYFLNLGYPLDMVLKVIQNVEINDSDDLLVREIVKLEKRLGRRYEGEDLKQQIKKKLYQKGFSLDKIDENICKVCEK